MASPATSEGVEVGRAGRRSDPKLRFSSEPGGGGGQSGSSLLNGVSDVQENHCLDAAREKKSAFQITRVVSRGGGGGAGGLDDSDSVDDRTGLDDPSSEMGDQSYQTNVVTNIDSEDVLYGSLEDVVAQLSPIHDELKEPDVQSRFRLVKIGTQEGVKRGRWHCLDFTDSALCGRPVEEPRSENPVDTAAGANDNIPSENICDSPTSGFNRLESHPSLLIAAAHGGVTAVNATPMVGETSHSPAAVMTGDAVFTSSDSLFPKADAGTEKELPNTLPFFGSGLLGNGDFSSRLQFVRENLFTNRSRKPSEANEVELAEGGASAVAIDNKIEQAMDLVKSHLMFAVREEVEQLKLKIQELTDRNSQLEYENLVLRESAPQETLAKLHKAPSGPPS